MRTVLTWIVRLSLCLAVAFVMIGGPRSAADYPLRIHVFQVSQHSHYRQGTLDYVDGEGRANLFENGEARGLDYGFRCSERLMTSPGYETYLARWKKPGKELTVLLPVMGKPDAAAACVIKVEVKNSAYFKHNGAVEEEPVTAFKDWMTRHQYDPEHGKDVPVNLAPAAKPAN